MRRAVLHVGEGEGGRRRHARDLGDVLLGQRLGVVLDHDLPAAVRHAVAGNAGRAVHVADVRLGVDRLRRHVERAVLNVVAHVGDHGVAEGLGVHERAAVGQLEVAVRLVDQLVVHVHVVVREAGVELEHLEDGRDAVPLDVHDLAQPVAVDRAGAGPLLDGQLLDGLGPVAQADGGAHGAVEQVDDEPVLADQPDQGLLGEVLVVEAGVEGTRVVVALGHFVRSFVQTIVQTLVQI